MAIIKIGGRAYKNGVRLYGDNYSVKAYYDKNENLRCRVAKNKFTDNKLYQTIKKIPFLRGIISIIFAFITLFTEVKKNPKRFWPIIVIILLDITRAVYFTLFANTYSGPSFFYSNWFSYLAFGATITFLIILRFTLLKDIFKFHGAEHKAVNYYQSDDDTPLATHSRLARRCGTNLVVIIFLLIFIVDSLTLTLNFYLLTFLAIGVAYEILLVLPRNLLAFPFLVQRFTTIEPDEYHLKAADLALKMLLHKERGNHHQNYSLRGV